MALAMGMGCASAQQTNPATLTPVRFSVIPLLTATPVYVALKEGYFREEGIDLRLTKIEGGAPIAQAIMAGSLDAGAVGSVPMMIDVARRELGECLHVHEEDCRRGTVSHGIIVLKDSGINSLADLKGKTIAVHTFGSLEDIRIRAQVLPSLKLTPADVRLVEVPFSVMEGALKIKRVDAVFPFQPFTAALMNNPDFKLLSDLGDLLPPNGYPVDTYIFATSFYEKNPQVVSGFDRAIRKAIKFVESD